MQTPEFLTNQFLIAMPALQDPNFNRTVTLVCEHNGDGALGLVINRPTDMSLGDIFAQMSLDDPATDSAALPVLQGGPVQQERGFVIHDGTTDWNSTLMVADGIRVTTSRDILVSMAKGDGPSKAVVLLGYAGWGAGQLESEMAANAWLTVPASEEIIFGLPYEERWQKAAELIGVDIRTLSGDIGHA